MKKLLTIVAIAAMAFGVTGCRPYMEPIIETVENNETAFLVPLDSSSKGTGALGEADYKQHQVMAKNVTVPQRWVKTGYGWLSGKYIRTARLIRVSRAPATSEWKISEQQTRDGKTVRTNDNAIWVESSDSIGFSIGVTMTAHIERDDAALFLNKYPSSTLKDVMDKEFRSIVQSEMADFAATSIMDKLREQKVELAAKVREKVIAYAEGRGITIDTIGLFGGFSYENPEVQKAIDNIFIAQQKKNEEAALLAAMADKKLRMDAEGEANANKIRKEAQGNADAILTVKKAEAEGITLVNNALEKAKENPMFVQIKELEVKSEAITKWNGSVPTMIMGGGGEAFVPMLNLGNVK